MKDFAGTCWLHGPILVAFYIYVVIIILALVSVFCNPSYACCIDVFQFPKHVFASYDTLEE